MILNTYFFGKKIEKLFNLKSTDQILDYGCGPGLLIDYLASLRVPITGADINESFIEECKVKHPGSHFIHITTNTEKNEEILKRELKKNDFDFIILLSISQYFENETELDSVIGLLKPCLKQDGKLIIADVIDPETSALKDTVSLFAECVRKNKVLSFTHFILYLVFSDYRKISKAAPLLVITEQSITRIAHLHVLNCQKAERLTLHPSRTNYILTKK